MCLADVIADQPQVFQRVRVLPELPPGFKVDGVDDEMRMDVVSIAVGGDQNFRTGPGTDCKFFCHFMRLPGRDVLRGFEGLDILVEVDAVRFAVGCLGRFELQNGIHPIAVDTADKPLAGTLVPSLVLSHAVPHDTSHRTKVLLVLRDKSYGSYAASPPRLMR